MWWSWQTATTGFQISISWWLAWEQRMPEVLCEVWIGFFSDEAGSHGSSKESTQFHSEWLWWLLSEGQKSISLQLPGWQRQVLTESEDPDLRLPWHLTFIIYFFQKPHYSLFLQFITFLNLKSKNLMKETTQQWRRPCDNVRFQGGDNLKSLKCLFDPK